MQAEVAARTSAVTPNSKPAANQWNYSGPAAYNPYSTSAPRTGLVTPFESWFQTIQVTPSAGIQGGGYTMNRVQTASEQGAQEALRLVQQYAPGATVESMSVSNPAWGANQPVYMIALPNGERMNAGLILDGYYNHGTGVNAGSDTTLAAMLGHILTGCYG